jgi:hypothetical protein
MKVVNFQINRAAKYHSTNLGTSSLNGISLDDLYEKLTIFIYFHTFDSRTAVCPVYVADSLCQTILAGTVWAPRTDNSLGSVAPRRVLMRYHLRASL